MANVVRDPKEHPDAIIPDLVKARSAGDLHEGRYRLRLRQQMEAALFQEGRRRLLPAAGAVGRHAQDLARLLRRQAGTDWWAAYYPADNMQRPTGPLCDGCHSVNYDIDDQDSHRVECRLREVPRPRQRPRRSSPPARTSSTRRAWITCTPTTSASSAIRRASR